MKLKAGFALGSVVGLAMLMLPLRAVAKGHNHDRGDRPAMHHYGRGRGGHGRRFGWYRHHGRDADGSYPAFDRGDRPGNYYGDDDDDGGYRGYGPYGNYWGDDHRGGWMPRGNDDDDDGGGWRQPAGRYYQNYPAPYGERDADDQPFFCDPGGDNCRRNPGFQGQLPTLPPVLEAPVPPAPGLLSITSLLTQRNQLLAQVQNARNRYYQALHQGNRAAATWWLGRVRSFNKRITALNGKVSRLQSISQHTAPVNGVLPYGVSPLNGAPFGYDPNTAANALMPLLGPALTH